MGMFDDLIPAQPDATSASPPGMFDDLIKDAELVRMRSMPPKPEYGTMFDPFMQGVTFGTFDEVVGVVGGIDSVIRGEGFGPGYDRAAGVARENLASYRDRHPMASTVGEVGGALTTLPFTPVINAVRGPAAVSRMAPTGAKIANAAQRGAANAANSALTGSIYGAFYGAGSADGSASNRAMGALESGGIGAGIGLVAPAVVSAGKGLAQVATGKSLPGVGRTLTGANRNAERAVVEALKDDAAARGITPEQALDEIGQAVRAGVPMTPLDVGATTGEATRDIARAAANISPQARAVLNRTLARRFETQSDRLIQAINTMGQRGGFGTNAPRTREALEAAARLANKPAYDRAYRDGASGVWHEGFEQLTVAPEMQKAIKDATKTGATESALRGARPPTNPFSKNADGTINPIPDVQPTLEFWDQVKVNLDSQIGRAQRKGDAPLTRRLTMLKQQLVGYLDVAVPSYANAREGAARFFGAENALDAGAAFVNRPVDNDAARKAIAAMSEPERALFAEGYASRLVENIREVPDRYSAINKLYQSPAAKERFSVALGDDAARTMEATLRLEDIMDMGRQAVTANSTTARQLLAAQLVVGGAAGAVMTGNPLDPRNLIGSALMVGMSRGAGNLVSRVDQQMARRIAEMLASDNPQVVKDALDRISRSPRLSAGLRSGHAYVSRALAPLYSREPVAPPSGSPPAKERKPTPTQ